MNNPEDEDLLKIEKFLEANGITVDYATCDENYLDIVEHKIVVSQKQSKKAIIYTLLHEVGHYFCDFYPEEQTPTTQVIEEVLAWDCGYDIGCSLGIRIDDEAWQSLVIESISGYIQKANL